MFASLGIKLGAVIFVLCASLLAMSIVVLYDSHDAMHAELRQKFGLELIREITEDGIGWMHALDDKAAAAALLARAARDNPHVALYLLGRNGDVLASSVAPDVKHLSRIDVAPLERILAGERRLPLMGDNPVDPSHPAVFAVAAVPTTGPVQGYLYMVLADEAAQGDTPISAGYAVREGAILLAGWAGLVLLAGLFVLKAVIRPLQRLTDSVTGFQGDNAKGERVSGNVRNAHDEIGRLAQSFAAMAKRITQQMADLRKHDADRRELFANISHDLRTPIASLLGYLETISLKPDLSEQKKQQYCEIAMQEARHLANLVDDLLELAKLDAPEPKIHMEAFALSELIETVCRTFEPAARERRVSLRKELPPAPQVPLVVADPALIERVLENLVDNALRHTPPDGMVTVAVASQEAAVGVTVTDTGSGIPVAEIPHIFDRFYRGKSREHGHQGAGLGLPIARRILELHGATLTVDSRPNVCTRFGFSLPVANIGAVATA